MRNFLNGGQDFRVTTTGPGSNPDQVSDVIHQSSDGRPYSRLSIQPGGAVMEQLHPWNASYSTGSAEAELTNYYSTIGRMPPLYYAGHP